MVGASSVSNGNSELVRAMLKHNNASIHLSTKVDSIRRDGNALMLKTNDNISHSCQDVVIAAPLEFTSIDFQNLNVNSSIPRRKFVNCTVTIVKAKSVKLSYFHLDDVKDLPNNIFTTSEASAPFTVLQLETDDMDDGYSIWKFFSVKSVPVRDIFNDISEVHVQQWPYTFPHLEPNVTFQPIMLAPNVYYLNTMESVASAMEGSIIAGRNVAMLISPTS